VIDVMGGVVVHARLGDRAHYQPIRTRLCDSPRIEEVVAALLSLFAFRRLYIADLDALLGLPQQRSALDALRRVAPNLPLWIDAGIRTPAELAVIRQYGTPVLATETLTAAEAGPLLTACPGTVLSIDYRGDRALGEPEFLQRLVQRLGLQPTHVIVLNLARVGGGQGPDLEPIEALRRIAPQSRFYAGGGIRNIQDLQRCRQAGAAGALVASALHDERIGRIDLQNMENWP
jgi:phosphoribosylformimino-5-aminoimidazole carboxamide ribotide isomerase